MKTSIHIFIIASLLSLVACTGGGTNQEVKTQEPADSSAVNTMGSPLIEALSEKIAASPDNAVIYAERASIYYDKDNFEAAITDLEKAISIDSSNFGFYHLLADAYLDNFQSEQAIETLESVVARDPKRISTLLKLSEFQMILTQHEASLGTIDKILKQSPKNAEGFYMLGMNFKQMGDTARAINSFQTTVEENPDHLDAYVELGILFDRKDKSVSLQYYDNALRIDSTNFEALFGKAWFFHQRNQFGKAEIAYKRAARFHPKESRIYFNHGILYLEISEQQKDEAKRKEANLSAYKSFDLATKVSPAYGNAYFYLGITAERLGDKERAIDNYRQAVALMDETDPANEAIIRLGGRPIMK